MSNFKFKRGDIVRCKFTGFTGFVDNLVEYKFGCNRYCVQPPMNEAGVVPDAYTIDEPCLELVEERNIEIVDAVPKLKLGYKVYDRIRDVIGVIMGRAYYLNGCIRVIVEVPDSKSRTNESSFWTYEETLEYVTTGRINKQPIDMFPEVTKEEKKEPKKPKTGGPLGRPSSKF